MTITGLTVTLARADVELSAYAAVTGLGAVSVGGERGGGPLHC
jgi:hypothetical protein